MSQSLFVLISKGARLLRILRHGTDFEVWNVASLCGRKVDWTFQVGQ